MTEREWQDDLDAMNPLQQARRELVLRQIRNEDLKLAVAEGQLMRVDLHRAALSDLVSTIVTFMDTLPDVLERKFALEGAVVAGLRDSVDNARDNLHAKLFEVFAANHRQPLALLQDSPVPPPPAPPAPPKPRGRPTNAQRAATAKASKK